jgi:hypothetical protein
MILIIYSIPFIKYNNSNKNNSQLDKNENDLKNYYII